MRWRRDNHCGCPFFIGAKKDLFMECPYCREEIADGAKKCRYCNEFLDKDADTHPSLLGQIDQISNILTDYVIKLIIWLFVGWCIWYFLL